MKYENVFAISAAVAITAVGLLVLAPPAFGKTQPVYVIGPAPTDVVTEHIGYADLNLASTAGERTLTYRVKAGVSELCNEVTGGYNAGMEYKFNMQHCRSSAWDQARPQIALAVQRAREIAMTGYSSIAASALTITLPK